MVIVLDTNVVVSGLIKPHGPPARLIDLVLSTAVRVAFDDRILAEYKEVLLRPRFGLSESDIDAVLDHIRLTGTPTLAGIHQLPDCPDPDDLPFAEVAIAARVDALVTGNSSHFVFLAEQGIRVMSPAAFLADL